MGGLSEAYPDQDVRDPDPARAVSYMADQLQHPIEEKNSAKWVFLWGAISPLEGKKTRRMSDFPSRKEPKQHVCFKELFSLEKKGKMCMSVCVCARFGAIVP